MHLIRRVEEWFERKGEGDYDEDQDGVMVNFKEQRATLEQNKREIEARNRSFLTKTMMGERRNYIT